MFITRLKSTTYIPLQLTDGLNQQQILENNCGEDSPQLRRSLSGGKRAVMAGFGETSLSVFKCRVWLPP